MEVQDKTNEAGSRKEAEQAVVGALGELKDIMRDMKVSEDQKRRMLCLQAAVKACPDNGDSSLVIQVAQAFDAYVVGTEASNGTR